MSNTNDPAALTAKESLINSNRNKYIKIARNMPCTGSSSNPFQERCSCSGWKPKSINTTSLEWCICGHKISNHATIRELQIEEVHKLWEIAVKIDEHLEKQGKLMDFEYEDAYVHDLRKKITSTINLNLKLSRKKSIDKDLRNENATHSEEQQYGTRLRLLNNDGSRDNLILLTGIKELFATALPHMPAQYIARVVYDRNHYSLAIVRDPVKVVGGICYRPFLEKSFIEIVFFAVDSDQQVRGYGTKLMNYFKDYIKDTFNITQFLVYADDFAVGFFRKNGFTDEITLDQDIWGGHLKDYTGATLMQCTLIPKVKYRQIRQILEKQKQAVKNKIAQTCKPPIIYRGLECFKNGVKSVDPMSVPGIRISGWTPQLEKQAKDIKRMSHYLVMKEILNRLKSHPSSLPFHEPVNGDDVPDYYDIIKDPMDLSTVLKRMENNRYRSLLEFAIDMQKIWNNAKIYNKSDTIFYKSAVELEGIFREAMFLKGLVFPLENIHFSMSEPATSSSSDSSKFNGECGKVRIFIRSPTTTLPDDFSILTSLDSSVLTLKRAIFETHPTKPNVRDQRLIYRGRVLNDSDTIINVLRSELATDQIFHLVVKPSLQTSAETTSTTNARIATPLTGQSFGTTGLNDFAQQPPNLNMPYFVPPSEHPHTYLQQINPQQQHDIPEPQQDAAARNQRRAATLWLIVKLGFLVYIFSQNASTERMILLYFMAFTSNWTVTHRAEAQTENHSTYTQPQQLPQMPVQQNPGGLPIPQPDLNNRNTPSSSSSTAHLPPSPMPTNDPNNARSITLQDVEHALWTFVASLIPTNAPDVGQQDDVAM
ncbi:25456_t:CDS:2 [Gigaspora rosea]|nr:25456_t:CDS:2 [Gigaspora rosea]